MMLNRGWVANDVAQRLREYYGVYHAAHWEHFLDAHNLDQWFDDLPVGVSAFFADGCVYVQKGMTQTRTMRHVWHEIGHWALHAGDYAFWLARPQGYITVAKFERQAHEFAALFPVWDE